MLKENGEKAVGKVQEFFEPQRFFSPEYVVEHTQIPEDPLLIPRILGYVGPTRCGSTGLLFLMAGHPEVDLGYFQPHKNGIRWGADVIIRAEDELVFMKDTIGPLEEEELFDPIEMLLQAAVPAEKITWIFALRNPLSSFASLLHFTDRMRIDFFARMQAHTIGLYERYRNSGVEAVPFVYDLLGEGELRVMTRLLGRVGLSSFDSLKFDSQAISQKTVWGEAENPIYFQEAVQPTLAQGEFKYVSRTVNHGELRPEVEQRLREVCMPGFEEFRKLARAELDL